MLPLATVLLLLLLPLSINASTPISSRGYHINCGSKEESTIAGIRWTTDEGFIEAGNVSSLLDKQPDITPLLSTLRYFPEGSARKFCYVIPVSKGAKYLVRTTYYYGGYDGSGDPPVFDQIVGGTRWSAVNTSENYARGLTSYYEMVVAAAGKTLSVCLARSGGTGSASPFISALEVEFLEDSMYNSTDFRTYALGTIARHVFGHDGQIVSYPDDPFNRYWEPFTDTNPTVESHSNISSSDFWNLPPEAAFQTALTTSRGKNLTVEWPPFALPATSYYIVLYFHDNRTPSQYSWRVFDVSINGKSFYTALNVTATGVMVYGTQWPLSGQTRITLTPAEGAPVGPVINAGEIFQLVPLNGRTHTRDVIAMEGLARSFENPPADWSGDPCLPREYSWTGVTCSQGKLARVLSLNLTNYGLSGSLHNSISHLTAISSIWLGRNKLSGSIPDMSSLKELVSLHLEDNQLSGSIPLSLGNLDKLQELFLQNNNLQGRIPDSLSKRTGINIQVSPGNQLEMH